MAELVRERDFEVFCLNDVDTPESDQEGITQAIQELLEVYFPYPSRFERSGS